MVELPDPLMFQVLLGVPGFEFSHATGLTTGLHGSTIACVPAARVPAAGTPVARVPAACAPVGASPTRMSAAAPAVRPRILLSRMMHRLPTRDPARQFRYSERVAPMVGGGRRESYRRYDRNAPTGGWPILPHMAFRSISAASCVPDQIHRNGPRTNRSN